MTEAEWLASSDPAAMLRWRIRKPDPHDPVWWPEPTSDRKLRLFACAACRLAWPRLTDDAPCGRCGGKGVIALGMSAPSHRDCSNCHGTGRVNRSRRAVE